MNFFLIYCSNLIPCRVDISAYSVHKNTLSCLWNLTHHQFTRFHSVLDREPLSLEYEKTKIIKMFEDSIIEPAQTLWAPLIDSATKKDGILRSYVNYHSFNALAKRNLHHILWMNLCIHSLGKEATFSTLVLKSGYRQIEIDESDQDEVSYTSQHVLYHFEPVPFKLKNAPGTFLRTIDVILFTVTWQFALVYLDHIVVYLGTPEKHIFHLQNVLILLLTKKKLHSNLTNKSSSKTPLTTSNTSYVSCNLKLCCAEQVRYVDLKTPHP